MICDDNSCGTGIGNIPKPGDPNNNGTLSAMPVVGAIRVSWTYPTLNPYAVAYSVLYRGITSKFEDAIVHAPQVGSGFFVDSAEPPTRYYYWIKFVSLNGTIGEPLGPVSSVAKSTSEETLLSLTGKIDAGVLAQALKGEINRIPLLDRDILNEIQKRIQGDTNLSNGMLDIQNTANLSLTAIINETSERKTADSAVVESINILYAQAGASKAAIQNEAIVRATKDEALAQQVSTVISRLGVNEARIQDETTARATADGALSSRITTAQATANNAASLVQSETTSRIAGDTALAQQLVTAQSSLNGNIAAVQTNLQTKINATDGRVNSIGALWTVKVNVNGLVGGFGVYNDGRTADAGFDVDTFFVGRTNTEKVKPFILSNGIVYIDKARIRNADIDTLKIAGNAVTVPAFATAYGTTSGDGRWQMVASVSIVLDEGGFAFASCTGMITYGAGWVGVSTYLEINGQTVSSGGGNEAWVNAVHSGGVYVGAGSVTAKLYFKAANGNARIQNPTIYLCGAKR